METVYALGHDLISQLCQPGNRTFCWRCFCLLIARSSGCYCRVGCACNSRPKPAKSLQGDTENADRLPSSTVRAFLHGPARRSFKTKRRFIASLGLGEGYIRGRAYVTTPNKRKGRSLLPNMDKRGWGSRVGVPRDGENLT